ncbi:MAG: hypothetical protein ACK4WD_08990 [Flavobacteriales bacterium]
MIFSLGCVGEQPKPEVTEIYGYYIAGLDSAVVQINRMNDDDGIVPVEDSKVTITVGQNVVNVVHEENGEYLAKAPENWAEAGETITLEIDDTRNSVAEAIIPPVIVPTLISNTSFQVEPNNPGASVFEVKWDPIEGVSYLLSLETLEQNPTEIPFTVPAGLFQNQFFAPIEENEVTLFDTDFKFYGRQRLTIFVIHDLYKDFFFFRNRGQGFLATQGPDNITGARGLWTCVNAYQIELNILE